MNSLWNKWIFDTISRVKSSVNLNKAGASSMEQKCHWWYYINIPVSGFLSFNWKKRLAINKAGSRSMKRKRYRQVISYFQITIPQFFKSLESERKFELSISNEMWQRVFISGVRSYIFIFIGYIPGLYFVSSCMWQLSTDFEEGGV